MRWAGWAILAVSLVGCDDEEVPEGVVLIFDDMGIDGSSDGGVEDASVCAPEAPRLGCPAGWQVGARCDVHADRCAPEERPGLVDGCSPVGPACAGMHQREGRCWPDPLVCGASAVPHVTEGCVAVGPTCAAEGCAVAACPEGEWWIPSEGCVALRKRGCTPPSPDAVHVRAGADAMAADGSAAAPLPSIQAGLAVAAPGQQIFIEPGHYDEPLSLAQRQLTLTGSCEGLVEIEADGPLLFMTGGVVTVENVRLVSASDAVTVAFGGQLELREAEVVGDVGVIASGVGTRVELADVAVTGLGPGVPVAFGRGLLAQEGGQIAAKRVAIDAAPLIGAHAIAPGSQLDLIDVSISRIDPTQDTYATGILTHQGAHATLDGVVIDATAGYAVRVTEDGELSMQSSRIQATTLPPDESFPGVGLQVESGGAITVSRSVIDDTWGIAVRASAGRIDADYLRIAGTRGLERPLESALTGLFWVENLAADLLAYEGGEIVFADGALLDTAGSAVFSIDGQTTLTRATVAGQQAPHLDDQEAGALRAGSVALLGTGARLDVSDSALQTDVGWAIYTFGSAEVDLRHTSLIGRAPGSLGIGGRGATLTVDDADLWRLAAGVVVEDATLTLTRSRIVHDASCEAFVASTGVLTRRTVAHLADLFVAGVCGSGVSVIGATEGEPSEAWSIEDLVVRDIRSPADYFGIGLSIGARLSGTAARVIVDDVDGPGVYLAGDAGKRVVRDLQVTRSPQTPTKSLFQLGLYGLGVPTHVERAFIDNAGHIGVWLLNVVDATLTDVAVFGTRRTVEDQALAEESGIGVAATTPESRPQTVSFKRLHLEDQHWGLVSQHTSGALACSRITGSLVGVTLFEGSDALSLDDPDNYIRGNTVNIAEIDREVVLPPPPAASAF